ncbi:MAG: LemA family protein [Bacteroidales bacterium]|nr:LemA family protein [Bacteroidales bacterium]
MKKSNITLLAILGAVALVVLWGISKRNSLVGQEEMVENAWSDVENVYQRRMDLIPNLVNTVQGAANFEKNTLTGVVEARSRVVNISADELTEENVAKFQKSQDDLTAALNKSISLTVEAYPELTATKGFQDLQAQLEGCENRIATERRNFNEKVKSYNVSIRRFPANIIAGMMGLEKKGYFKASEGAEKPVEVKFE